MAKTTKQKAQKRDDQQLIQEGQQHQQQQASANKAAHTEDDKHKKAVHWSDDHDKNKVNLNLKKAPPDETSINAATSPSSSSPKMPTKEEKTAPNNKKEDETMVFPGSIAPNNTRIEEDIIRFWHMLPWMQRKEIAQRYGYQKIGDFEEYMTMQQAIQEEQEQAARNSNRAVTSSRMRNNDPYSNELAYPELIGGENVKGDNRKPAAATATASAQEQEEEMDSETEQDEENNNNELDDNNSENNENEDEANSDSLLLTFPDEILHKIFSFLPVTLFATKLAYVTAHPHWKRLTRSEHTMKILCERVYLQQAKKKQLRIAKFFQSYRYMLYSRPRVQAGGGVYVLRFGRVKPIQRDMWTEVPVGAILETVYYRYLYFEENGSCLYALTTIPPHDMLKRFHRVLLESSRGNVLTPTSTSQFNNTGRNKKQQSKKLTKKEREQKATELDTRVVWGTYTIQKNRLTVTAKQS